MLPVRSAPCRVGVEEGGLKVDPDVLQPDFHLLSSGGRSDPTLSGGSGGWVRDLVTNPAVDAGNPADPFDQEPPLSRVKREGMNVKLRDVLKKKGISKREFWAIFSPYCVERVIFRHLPVIRDLFQGPGMDQDGLTPEECQHILLTLIPRGFIRKIENSPRRRISRHANPLPTRKGSITKIGDLVFTRKGYLLHRSIIRAIFGYICLKRYDA